MIFIWCLLTEWSILKPTINMCLFWVIHFGRYGCKRLVTPLSFLTHFKVAISDKKQVHPHISKWSHSSWFSNRALIWAVITCHMFRLPKWIHSGKQGPKCWWRHIFDETDTPQVVKIHEIWADIYNKPYLNLLIWATLRHKMSCYKHYHKHTRN